MFSVKLPEQDRLVVQFAHPAYRLHEAFAARNPGIAGFQTWNVEDTLARVHEADVLVISGLWRPEMLSSASRLRYVQSIGVGFEQFPLEELRQKQIMLCNASGANRDAVAQHAMALVLALYRKIPQAVENQRLHKWRGMISQIAEREDDLCGRTMLILGLGSIGSTLCRLAKAFGMKVIGIKRNPASHASDADEVLAMDKLSEALPRADVLVLTCPLNEQTRSIVDENVLKRMKPEAYLVNVARGRCVEEDALFEALSNRQIAGAAIDHFWDEPLPEASRFWGLDNILITPHSAGETQKYEANLIGYLLNNISAVLGNEHAKIVNRIV